MKPVFDPPPSSPFPPSPAPCAALRRDSLRELTAMGVALLLIGIGLGTIGGMGIDYVVKAAVVYALGAVFILRGLGAHPHMRFGAANRVTLSRLMGMALIAALIGEAVPSAPPAAHPLGGWLLIVFATVTAVLDALDGALARRQGLSSRFGARFDMETDAAFMLVLCALVWQAGQAGPWVLASGLMRYAFVAAATVWPWLNAPLPPRKRRQAVCVVQITALIVCLGPIVSAPMATAIAALSLLLLSWSFAVDIHHLARQRAAPPESRA